MDNTPSRLGHIPRTYSTRSEHSFISPLIEEKDYVPYRVSTSQVSERDEHNHHVEKVFKNKENIVKGEQIISLHKRIDILLQKLEKSLGKKALLVKPPLKPPPEIEGYKLKTIEELKDSLEKLFIEYDESEEITSESEIDQITDHSKDSENNTCPCKQGHSNSEHDTQEEDYYKLISQFKDSDINVLTYEIQKYEFSKISYYTPRFIWRN
ncbi:hypothetical protein M9H77_30728 [Catharanthus roseus]|uniref:Uncharacterized protein n=1 Tax=Catharanthus roseus TaxID=4058 RepID=A0ACB9ZZ01_CATRO|nr:hypothetical protein M9H77_30728 [Catharanthus roseus]